MNNENVEVAGQKAEAFYEFLREHNIANDGLRLGQRFVNIYISQPWPELFYEQSDKVAMEIIAQWLLEHQYYNTMPPLTKKR